MLNKKHKLKSGKNKDKKRDFERKTRQDTKKSENIDEGKLCNLIFWCCSFHETKAKKKEKERKRQKQGTKKESQKERQEGRKKDKNERERERERQRKSNWIRGGAQKRLRRNKGRHSKINKKCPFLREKRRFFFCIKKAKKGKRKTRQKNKIIINKEGLGPSEVALWVTWSLNPRKNKNKTKTKQKQNKNKTKKTKNKKTKTHKNTKQRAFQLSVKIFFCFWWVSKFSLFWQLGPESAHPKNTIKIGVSARHFLKNRYASRNRHFWTKKSQIQTFQLSFFGLFLLFQQKTPKLAETPIFIVFEQA